MTSSTGPAHTRDRSLDKTRDLAHQPWFPWAAFALVHIIVSIQGLLRPGVLADVSLYSWWVESGIADEVWPVLSADGPFAEWVYPIMALVPMVVAYGLSTVLGVHLAWLVLATGASAVAFGMLRRDSTTTVGSWFWLSFVLLSGPIALARLDIFVAVSVCVALCVRLSHPWLAAVLLTVGAWIKVVPGMVLWPLVVSTRSWLRRVIVPALAVCFTVAVLVALTGALPRVLSFLGAQSDRGLQAESVGASAVQVIAQFADPAVIAFNEEISTYEITGGITEHVVKVIPWLLIVATLSIMSLVWRARRNSSEVMTWGALALLTWAIIGNKVGSPQFQIWLLAPIAFGLSQQLWRQRWRLVAGLALAAAGLTQLIYPVFYSELLRLHGGAVALLAVRNLLVLIIGVIAMRSLWQLGGSTRRQSTLRKMSS